MDIKGFKSSDGTIHKYDYGALANVPQSEETPAAGADGGYYTPVVTQPDDNTLQFDFTPSDPEMPSVKPVQVTLPSPDSGGNADQSGGGLSTTAVNLLMDVLNAVQYHTNVSGKIEQLREALLSGSSGGGDTGGGEDEPDEPVVTDDITVSNGIMTIVTVGSAITVSDGVMAIA